MLENTWYSVISPESCSSILWRSWDFKETAAEALKLTADHMEGFGLIDGIVEEPLGGAHNDPEGMAVGLAIHIKNELEALKNFTPEERINMRIEKYSSMGRFETKPQDEESR
jgi:acetyl-CoA carboxylase carboxyl transferase subunit alpha